MIYLDHAATSSPETCCRFASADSVFLQGSCASGRGSYQAASHINREIWQTRVRLAELLGSTDPARVIFCSSCTDALNTVILGLVKHGDRVLTTVLEHNSILRPLRHLELTAGAQVRYLTPTTQGMISPDSVKQALDEFKPQVMIITHVSNVTGIVQPVEEIALLCRATGVKLIVDGAQSAGHLPVNLRNSGITAFAASGHKGLLGPLGTGVLVLGDLEPHELTPLRFGGTGTHSEELAPPMGIPERFEAGNLNVPGILGLQAALNYSQKSGYEFQRTRELQLLAKLLAGLQQIPSLKLLEPTVPLEKRVGIVSVMCDTMDAQTLAQILDVDFEIAVRAGLHCAPLAHRHYGTLEQGGTLRISLGHATTENELDQLQNALLTICG